MKYTTFSIGTLRFSAQTDPRTGTPYVHSIHPYDETEYHWARKSPAEFEVVARKLLNLDREAHLTRKGGIW